MTGILFDLDGTLLDTLTDLASAVNHTLESFGYPLRTLEEVRQFVGNGVARLMQLAVPAGKDWEEPLASFRRYYSAHCQDATAPYPGISPALEKIAERHPVAIVSNKPDAAVKSLCARYFPGIQSLGERPDCPRKPAPDMVWRAMEQLGVERCIYVGDSEVDVATAKNAGVPCLCVLWGFRTRQELEEAGAAVCCETPEQLNAALENMIKESEADGQ